MKYQLRDNMSNHVFIVKRGVRQYRNNWPKTQLEIYFDQSLQSKFIEWKKSDFFFTQMIIFFFFSFWKRNWIKLTNLKMYEAVASTISLWFACDCKVEWWNNRIFRQNWVDLRRQKVQLSLRWIQPNRAYLGLHCVCSVQLAN